MNVSSVKNLNGETFSAVQDAALTNVVQTNSANWQDISAYQNASGTFIQNNIQNLNIGEDNILYGARGIAQGTHNSAYGNSISVGNSNIAAPNSFAQGYYNSALSAFSFAQGQENYAWLNSFVQGLENIATGNSFAQGFSNSATFVSLAQGQNNSAYLYSVSIGSANISNSASIAVGFWNSAIDNSQTFGRGLKATNSGMAIGTFNDIDSAAFVIGNGTDIEHKSDNFIIYHDGSVSAAGKISANGVELGAGGAGGSDSANHLNQNGTMGGNIHQSGAGNFYYMPTTSPFGKPQGIFSPLQYATGACLAMDNTQFAAYFKGNEWYVSNTGVGQMLRGETHQSRGVHISGATTAGYGFDLSIKAVSGLNSTGTWKYGVQEDRALRTVSALEYNAVDEISGIAGSAIAQYGAEKQWLVHDDTIVSISNSAQYALGCNISALQRLMGIDETVLFSGNATTTDFPLTLNEPMSSFETIKFYWQTFNYNAKNWTVSEKIPVGSDNYYTLFDGIYNTGTKAWFDVAFAFKEENGKLNYISGAYTNWNGNTVGDASTFLGMFKIVGIGRKQ